MFKAFLWEMNKIKSPIKIIGIVLVIFLLTALISAFEFHMIFQVTGFDVLQYMLYNLSFVLIKMMLPVILILHTSAIFAGDYSSGAMKSFLLCGMKREKYYGGKFIYLILVTAVLSIGIFFSLFIVSMFFGGTVFFLTADFFKILLLYIVAGIGTIPIILITIFLSFLFNDFEKTITCSFVIFFLSITCDSVFKNSLFSPTGILSNSNLFYNHSFKNYLFVFTIWLLYFVLFNIINLVVFRKKDIWN